MERGHGEDGRLLGTTYSVLGCFILAVIFYRRVFSTSDFDSVRGLPALRLLGLQGLNDFISINSFPEGMEREPRRQTLGQTEILFISNFRCPMQVFQLQQWVLNDLFQSVHFPECMEREPIGITFG